ncbi:MAG: metallophosphoesterase family protein [bacterium]|nr:metallophosphoesterase family protein [bacterium]
MRRKQWILRCLVGYMAINLCSVVLAQGVGIEPRVDISAKGTAKVSWDTEHGCVGGAVSFGVNFEDDPLALLYYRLSVSATGSRRSHAAEISIEKIEALGKGLPFQGQVFYRATCFDLSSKTLLDSGDCVFRYIKQGADYRRGVAIVEGPIVANVTSSSALVRWVTDLPSGGRVCLGTKSASAMGPQIVHEVAVEGLQPSTVYAYRVEAWTGSDDVFRTREYSFRTAPALGSDEPFSFAVFSDTRANDYTPISVEALNGVNADIVRRLAVGVLRNEARFAVIAGDLISGITSDSHRVTVQLRSWKKAVGPIAPYIPFYTGIGNHDAEIYDLRTLDGKETRVRKEGKDAAEEIFRREMTNPTNGPDLPADSTDPPYSENVYSFDYGDSHFVMLNNDYKVIRSASQDDAEKGKIVGRQLEWFQRDLRSATERGQENIFVFVHEPAFPNGGHLADSMYHSGDKTYTKLRDEFWRLLCEHPVAAVFCGHEHSYSRTLIDEKVDGSFRRPIWQVTTGGGGAPFHTLEASPWSSSVKAFSSRQHYCLIKVAGKEVRLFVYDPAGSLIEEARLK